MSDVPETTAEAPAPEAPAAEAAAPAAPAAAPSVTLGVGESIQIDAAAMETILPAERALTAVLINLALHTERARAEEKIHLENAAKARKEFEDKVRAAGVAAGLNFSGNFQYQYNQDKRTFTRTA
jgi:hypothetical protein